MLQPSFRIHQEGLENANLGEARLFIDAGQMHFAFAIMQLPENLFIAFEFYQIKPTSKEDDLSQICRGNSLLLRSYRDVTIAFNTRESVLIPGELYKPEDGETILSMIHGDLQTGMILQEHLPGQDIFNVYRVPAFLHNTLSNRFSSGHYWHFYTILLQVLHQRKNELPGEYFYASFYPNQVIIGLVQNHVCQLIQTFIYEIPEDVTYHLLNISEQFELDNKKIPILISGLIDTKSALHAELIKYFVFVETDNGGDRYSKDKVFETYPEHFFTPVFSMALCE